MKVARYNGSNSLEGLCSHAMHVVLYNHVIVKELAVATLENYIESTQNVYKYDSKFNDWSSLPITSYYTFALALMQGYVIVISSLASNVLYSFHEEETKNGVKSFLQCRQNDASMTHLVALCYTEPLQQLTQ